MSVTNLTEAVKLFLDQVGGRLIQLMPGQKGPLCAVLGDGFGNRVYLFFKRDWLHSYGHLFPSESWKGWGQTANLKVLRQAALDGAWIVVVAPSGAIYKCEARDWLDYAEKHGTIRTPSTEIGQEASIPSEMMKRVEIAA